MRILFGVQGTGNGHISRCRTLAKALNQTGVSVEYVFSGRAADKYFDMQDFGHYRCYPGMSFITENGQISITKTLYRSRVLRLIKDIKQLDVSSYDLIISDFEPITAWAAKLQNKPSLGISNQAIFNYLKLEKRRFIANSIMKYYAPVTTMIGLHWFHFGYPLLPPIIEKLESTGENGHILIYLPFERLDKLERIFSATSCEQYICFHPEVTKAVNKGNIYFLPLSHERFVQELQACSGMVTNAGFSSISEALSIGKKVLIKPLQGQFEQNYNAKCLRELGLAMSAPKLDQYDVENWLVLQSQPAIVYPDVASELAKWIADEQREPLANLSQRLWQETSIPPHIQKRLMQFGFQNTMI